MPSTYAHYVFGREVLSELPAPLAALAREHRQLYDIGLHGPDILFYYRVLTANAVNAVGYATHGRRGSAFFAPALEHISALSGEAREKAEAYALGFLCHFALDSACHGYIENKIAVSGVTHTEIESEFDRYLLLRDGVEPLSARLVGHIVPSAENSAVISPFFAGVDARHVGKALRSMRFYNALLRAPHQPKRGLVNFVLRLSGNYPEMHGMMIARHPIPACADSNLRLAKLMERARGECIALAENFFACIAGKAELSPAFDRTFGPPENWREIPVLTLEEEKKYEV